MWREYHTADGRILLNTQAISLVQPQDDYVLICTVDDFSFHVLDDYDTIKAELKTENAIWRKMAERGKI